MLSAFKTHNYHHIKRLLLVVVAVFFSIYVETYSYTGEKDKVYQTTKEIVLFSLL